jgi:hypothetical protein
MRGLPNWNEEDLMRRIVLLVAAAALASGGAAWAGVKSHSVNVKLTQATVVSGKMIPAGDYHLSWTGDSSEVHVTFEEGRQVVAQVDATLKQLTKASPQKELISRTMKDGKRALEEVRFRNEKTVLAFPLS